MKIKKTHKLYYRSFPYKAKLIADDWVTAAFRMKPYEVARILMDPDKQWGKLNKAVAKYPNQVVTLMRYLSQFNKDNFRMRWEYSVSIFFKDRKIVDELNSLCPDMGPIVAILWEPDNDEVMDCLLTNQRIEVKKELTHGCRYKVYLGNLSKSTPDNKDKFHTLVENNPGYFEVPESMKKSLIHHRTSRYYWGTGYFYVKDSKFLLLAQMLLNPIIKEVVKTVTYEEVATDNVPNS